MISILILLVFGASAFFLALLELVMLFRYRKNIEMSYAQAQLEYDDEHLRAAVVCLDTYRQGFYVPEVYHGTTLLGEAYNYIREQLGDKELARMRSKHLV